jgi:Sec-independent protein translocase protein TatA
MSNASIVELFIIIPVVILKYNTSYYGVLAKSISRMLRIFKSEIFIKKNSDADETNVNQ